MGTNHYLRAPVCFCCGKEAEEPIHLGKGSIGWCYGLHVRPEWSVHDYEGILSMIKEKTNDGWRIEDEYGDVLPLEVWQENVTKRRGRREVLSNWYQRNSASPGPFNLARHRVNGWHCIGHGEGTYDYIVGDFS